jgi:predicted regulator of Ras-like GTPase activity (Roadblock/LC7/MglB family)
METVKDPRAIRPPVLSLAPPSPSAVPSTSCAAPALTAGEALDQLVRSIPGTHGAVLASVDGFPLAKSHTMPAEPSHAAMLAAATGLARQLVTMGSGTTLRQMVVDHDGGSMLVWPIGSQRVLAVLADASVDQRSLRNFVQINVRVLANRPGAGAS